MDDYGYIKEFQRRCDYARLSHDTGGLRSLIKKDISLCCNALYSELAILTKTNSFDGIEQESELEFVMITLEAMKDICQEHAHPTHQSLVVAEEQFNRGLGLTFDRNSKLSGLDSVCNQMLATVDTLTTAAGLDRLGFAQTLATEIIKGTNKWISGLIK